MMGGKGPMAVTVMWVFTALTWLFVCLRLYTRYFILHQTGVDDHVYFFSGILLLLYTVFIHISATHGFGQSIHILPVEESALAVKYEMIGQTFSVIGMGVAKTSLGLFLLRIVVVKWHKILIWAAMTSLMIVSIFTAAIFWAQCTPAKKIYDPLRTPEGSCDIPVTPFATTLGVWCAIVDFIFALFPWVFIWGLNMNYREKMTIAGSMSFGIVAGICGIVRTYEVAIGFTDNYTLDTVPLIIWSAAEMAVTLICIGIPILRPLYRRTVQGSNFSSDRYKKQSEGYDEQGFRLDRVGHTKKSHDTSRDTPKQGISCPCTITRIAGENNSDESILGPEYRGNTSEGSMNSGIHVKQDVRVDWSESGL